MSKTTTSFHLKSWCWNTRQSIRRGCSVGSRLLFTKCKMPDVLRDEHCDIAPSQHEPPEIDLGIDCQHTSLDVQWCRKLQQRSLIRAAPNEGITKIR